MLSGPALAIALGAAFLIYGGSAVSTGVKKVSHAVSHVFHHKHKKPAPSVSPAAKPTSVSL